jgi:uncharacterized protein YdaU (DUF1376 family)
MNRPWMPLYIADYIRDTSHLRALESGAYLHLIMAYWVSGKLPNDDRQLATIAKLTDREWKACKAVLAEFFGPDWSSHKRIDKELAETAKRGEVLSEKARNAANKRWSKHAASMPQASPEHIPSNAPRCTLHTSHNTKEEKIESCAVAKATRPKHSIDFEEFWKSYPRRQGANPKTPAFKAFDAVVKSGTDPAAIIAGARRCAIADRDKIGTPFIPQAVKWLRDRRWEDYPGEINPSSPTALLTITPADRSWNAWKSHFRDTGQNGRAAIMDKSASDGKPFTVQSEWPPGMAA